MGLRDLIYVKKCLGLNARPFEVYKIRTMGVNAEEMFELLVVNGFDSFGKIIGDSRITPTGKFLRKYWVDELPQLYNLVRGDIKLVGIRPMSETTWQRYPKEIMRRALQQKPGLMGIDYAFTHSENFDDKLERIENYLNQWERNPIGTDREYFSRIVKNIIFGGIRSS